MKISYDKTVNASYVNFDPEQKLGYSVHTHPCDPLALHGEMINLDLNSDYILLGIEILAASKHVPSHILNSENLSEEQLRVTYKKLDDVAYIHINSGSLKNNYVCDPEDLNGTSIRLDFDENFVLLGVEVQDASKHLPQEVLDSAQIIE